MKLHQFEDASQFYEQVKDYLLCQEALHSFLLGMCNILIRNPDRFPEKPYLATVEVDGDIVAVAIRTPPQNLLLSKIQDFGVMEAIACDTALRAIAQDLLLTQEPLPGINAPIVEAKAFAQAWSLLTGQSHQLTMGLRAFQLEQVQPIPQATGHLRIATESDRQLLMSWYKAYLLEALDSIASDPERWVEHQLKVGTIYLWEDGVPVSIACRTGLTPNGARLGMVYTPPEYRRQGYASACVAALSQTLLDQGHRYCFLFTDLANPTSNHIYQAIGYQPVGDFNNYSFIRE